MSEERKRSIFWFIMPNKELAKILESNHEITTELEKVPEEDINFQWDPDKLKMTGNDLAIVCLPEKETQEWHDFFWNDCWLNPRIFTLNERDLLRHLPPNDEDGYSRICQVISILRALPPE